MTLNELFERGKWFAKQCFKNQGGIDPMWIIETSDGKHIPVSLPMSAMQNKQAVVAALKELFKEMNAVRYVSLLEAWSLEIDKTKDPDKVIESLQVTPVRDRPDRKEVVYIIAEDKYHQIGGMYYIIRPKDGDPYLSDFKEYDRGIKSEGTFTNLLEQGEAVQ